MIFVAEDAEHQVIFELCAGTYQRLIFEDLRADDFVNLSYRDAFDKLQAAFNHSQGTYRTLTYALIQNGGVQQPHEEMPLYDAVALIKQFALRRNYGVALEELQQKISDPAACLEHHEIVARVAECADHRVVDMPMAFNEILTNAREAMENSERGITTGLPDIDRQVFIEQSAFVIVGARAKIGKTSFALSILNHCVAAGKRPAYWCGEMGREELIWRQVSLHTGVPFSNFQRNALSLKDRVKYSEWEEWISSRVDNQYWLWAGPGVTVAKISDWLRSVRPDFAVLDYAHLIHSSKEFYGDPVAKLTDVISRLQDLRQELRIPIILLAQLNRKNASLMPNVNNLKGSGAYEQAATTIFLLDRPQDDPHDLGERPYVDRDGVTIPLKLKGHEGYHNAVIQCALNRNGPTGYWPVTYVPEIMKVEPWRAPSVLWHETQTKKATKEW